MECPKCGKANKPDAAICSNCYFDLQSSKTPVNSEVTVKPRQASPLPSQNIPNNAQPQQGVTNPNPGAYTSQSGPGQAPFQGPAAFSGIPIYEYIGFWTRVGAYILDSIILTILYSVICIPMGPVSPDKIQAMAQAQGSANLIALGISPVLIGWTLRFIQMQHWLLLIAGIYSVGLNTAYGATLGKMAAKIKIIKKDGSQLGFGYALIRFVFLNFIFLICILLVPFTEKKQGLHDLIAGTVVVRR